MHTVRRFCVACCSCADISRRPSYGFAFVCTLYCSRQLVPGCRPQHRTFRLGLVLGSLKCQALTSTAECVAIRSAQTHT